MAIRGVLLDIAGVLHDGRAPYPGAIESVKKLSRAGLAIRFVTNTSRRTRRATVDRLRTMGFDVQEQEVFTAPLAARALLRSRNLRPLLVIHPQLSGDFEGMNTRQPNAVFLADAAEHFTYNLLDRAFSLLVDGGPLIAVGRNRYFREGGRLHMDAGGFVAALEYASGQNATVVGKPSATFFDAVLNDMGLGRDEAVMIGDDVEADVLGAIDCGLSAILVQTGKYRDRDAGRLQGTAAELSLDIEAAVDSLLHG